MQPELGARRRRDHQLAVEAERYLQAADELVERQRQVVVAALALGRGSEEAQVLLDMMTAIRDQMKRQRELLLEAAESLRSDDRNDKRPGLGGLNTYQ